MSCSSLRGLSAVAVCSSLLGIVLTVAPPAFGASFGAPPGGSGRSDGFFVLVGEDADPANNAFGDITNELDLFIEVTGTTLDLCVDDPGLWSAAFPKEDFSFDTASPYSAKMDYALYAPGSATPLVQDNTTWGADDAASDGKCWTLYNGPVTPGVYRFVARMPDGPGVDVDVNVFGVRTVPDYDAYAYYATVGHSTWSGAQLLNGSIKLYPWAATGSRRTSAGEEVCGLDLVSWDLDAAMSQTPPPDVTIRTRLNWVDSNPPYPSLDGTFRLDHWDNMAPLNASDDVGIFTLEFGRLTLADGVVEANWPTPPVGFDFNAFSFQVWDLGNLSPFDFSEYPITPPDPRMATRNSRRLYLPLARGAAPVKEFLAHRILNPPVAGDFDQGVSVPVNVELRIDNPTAYVLTAVSGQTVLNPGLEVTNLRSVAAAGGSGGMATATGKTIDWSFATIPAGAAGRVTYTVDFKPTAVGFYFLTGDGTDFMGGASPTTATWNTPFAMGETARPCMIETRVRKPSCGATAVPAGPTRVCLDETVALVGGGSTPGTCTGPLEYRWTGPGLPASPPFGSNPDASPVASTPGNAVFTLEVRCSTDTLCADSKTVTVAVSTEARAPADAGADRSVGACSVPFKIGTPGDTVKYDYLWSPAGDVSSATIPEPDFINSTLGSYTLTLTVTPKADPLCAATDTIQIDVTSGTPTGSLGNSLRAVELGADVVLSWPLGVVVPDNYNVHRTLIKTELDKTAYTAPVLNTGAITAGTYTDSNALPGSGKVFHYETYGRDCLGNSVIQ